MKTDNIYSMCQELENNASLEGTEIGEMWSLIAGLWIGYRDYIDPELQKALEKNIQKEYHSLKNDYAIEENERTIKSKHLVRVN